MRLCSPFPLKNKNCACKFTGLCIYTYALDEQNKPYALEFEEHDGYLHVIVGGLRVTSEIALAYWQEVIDECEKLGYSKILLEHNFVEMISKDEMLQVIGPVGHLLKGRMFAFYDHYEHYEIPEAGKAILRSLDIKMQIFHDLQAAQRWLTAN